MNYFCSAITEIDNLGGSQPRLSDGVPGPVHREQKAGALWGGKSHEEGFEPGLRVGGGLQYLMLSVYCHTYTLFEDNSCLNITCILPSSVPAPAQLD